MTDFLWLKLFWCACFVFIGVYDFKKHLILNAAVFPMALIAVAFLIIEGHVFNGLIGAAIGALFAIIFCVIFKAGAGDGKLLVLMGLALGFPKVIIAVIAGTSLVFFVAVLYMRNTFTVRSPNLPLGAFLGTGAIITLFCGDKFVDYFTEAVMNSTIPWQIIGPPRPNVGIVEINEVTHPELLLPLFIILVIFGLALLSWAVILWWKKRKAIPRPANDDSPRSPQSPPSRE